MCLQGPAHRASLDPHGALSVNGTLLIPEEHRGSRRPGHSHPKDPRQIGSRVLTGHPHSAARTPSPATTSSWTACKPRGLKKNKMKSNTIRPDMGKRHKIPISGPITVALLEHRRPWACFCPTTPELSRCRRCRLTPNPQAFGLTGKVVTHPRNQHTVLPTRQVWDLDAAGCPLNVNPTSVV